MHDSDHFTALLIAANYGHTETIAVLLKHKANVMATDKNDKSILFQCAEEDRLDAIQVCDIVIQVGHAVIQVCFVVIGVCNAVIQVCDSVMRFVMPWCRFVMPWCGFVIP